MVTDSKKINNLLKSLFKQFIVIVLYIFLTVLLQLLLIDLLKSNNNILEGLSYLLIELSVLLVFMFIFKKNLVHDLPDFKKKGKKYIKECFKYYGFGLLAMAISNIIISYFIGIASNESGNRELLGNLPISSIINIIIIAPVVEELMVRVPLKDAINNKLIYCFISGLIFGGLHLIAAQSIYELFYIIPYGALGFSLAYIYQKTNNVCANIFFHSFHNTIAVILIILGGLA